MATIIGEQYGKPILSNKSLEGSVACLVSCLLVGVLMTRISPAITPQTALAGAVTATIVELLPIPVDDNLTIPVISAGMMTLAKLCFG